MPIYEYQCTGCKHVFDEIQKITDAPLEECPECHKKTVVKLVSPAGFQLKGTGWYVTDFKDKGQKKPEVKKDSTSETTKSASETKTSDSKTSSTKGESD